MFPRIFFIFFLILSPSYENESEGPSETECRPYIEKALQREGVPQERTQPPDDVGEPPQDSRQVDPLKDDLSSGEAIAGSSENVVDSNGDVNEVGSSEEVNAAVENVEEGSTEEADSSNELLSDPVSQVATESIEVAKDGSDEQVAAVSVESTGDEAGEISSEDQTNEASEQTISQEPEVTTNDVEDSEITLSVEVKDQGESESDENSIEVQEAIESEPSESEKETSSEQKEQTDAETPQNVSVEVSTEDSTDSVQSAEEQSFESETPLADQSEPEAVVNDSSHSDSVEIESTESQTEVHSLFQENETVPDESASSEEPAVQEQSTDDQSSNEDLEPKVVSEETSTEEETDLDVSKESVETAVEKEADQSSESNLDNSDSAAEEEKANADNERPAENEPPVETVENLVEEANLKSAEDEEQLTSEEKQSEPELPEEELIMPIEIPSNLRTRDHLAQILKLTEEADGTEGTHAKIAQTTLHDLKKIYDAAIKPLELLYKYRDLSNRHFGDPEIFSKPLILFMGPWSGGKSTIINYLLDNEFKKTALRSGAEPSPAYFNLVMWGEYEEVLDGTQLAADWTFSGLQKFGQGLLDRLRGLKLNHPLLEKVNIVEIPGILEIRKQVERLFPFNDACQWFIDRADIIFLVYDPSKLDVGPETEAILDQLKGREMQTRIILNKADQVKPEELMRVQGTLIWNISPLMSSTEPPVMYSASLWSLPYEIGAPARLLYAQECSFLKDLREAIDKRVENKISSARRFAVRVRNHAKMVDCYLTTYYNHKTFFGNKKKVSDDIIEHPQNYHIYEGLSTLTNISRYDLPDPEVYRDFFRLNPVYEFQQLSSTCTYFRGCPINRLDVAIAYDLPELIGKYKKAIEGIQNSKK